MKTKKFITKVVLLLLIVTGCLTFRSIQAAGNNSITFTFELPPKEEGDYDYGDKLEDEDGLVFDLYYIAPIKWDGAGDGTPASTKYYIPSGDIVESYQGVFPASFEDTNGNINVSERDGSLVNTALKEYGLDNLANDIATIVFSGTTPLAPDATAKFGTPETDLDDGLYLAIVRGSNANTKDKYIKTRIEKITVGDTVESKTVYYSYANSIYHEYDFNPLLVFLKNTTNETDLSLEAKPKYSENPRYDDLLIIKELGGVLGKAGKNDQDEGLDFDAFEPVTFVYDVTAYDPKETTKVVYHDVASISFEKMESAKDLIGQTIAEKIPVGARVVVTEIYNGSSYVLNADMSNGETTIIVSDRNEDGTHIQDDDGKYVYISTVDTSDSQTEKVIFAYVTFVNDPGNKPNPGYGINNPYKYDEEKGWEYVGDNKKPNTDDKRGG